MTIHFEDQQRKTPLNTSRKVTPATLIQRSGHDLISGSQFPNLWRLIITLIFIPLISQCQISPVSDQANQSGSASNANDSLPFNQVQFLGSHNSYKRAIEPELLQVVAETSEALALSLDYAQASLPDQLDLGIRKLELDIFYDPAGDLYREPGGLKLTTKATEFDPAQRMHIPGFKVFHVQDIDFRSHCLLFVDCLQQLADWSSQHPGHFPITILINAKDSEIAQLTKPLKFDQKAWADLDREIRSTLGERLVTPDDIRGSHDTLRQAVLAGWPTISALRGKILFILDDSIEKKQAYAGDHPSLRGRTMFVDAEESLPEASFRVINDPIADFQYIRSLVKQGFIVRTRADADTIEARTGDTRRLIQALESGAQIISTDYYRADKRFKAHYLVKLPNGAVARCNPVLVERACEFDN